MKEQNILILKTLIQNSPAFNGEQKKCLLQNIENLNPIEIKQAIALFEEEKKRWLLIKQQSDVFVEQIQTLSKKSLHELKTLAQNLIQKKEGQDTQKEN